MSPGPSASAGSTVCWNCGQQLSLGQARCLYCGVPQDAQSAQFVLAPHGVVSAPSAPEHASATVVAPAWTAGAPSQRVSPLGEAFAGAPASMGLRLVALTIDAVAMAAVVIAVAVATASLPLAILSALELAIGLWVLQARTGTGLGTALLRMRVSRSDEPFSPGIERAALRCLVTAAGALVFLVGAWVVEATAAWDRSPLRRSWGDRVSGTVVVAVPRNRDPVGAPERRLQASVRAAGPPPPPTPVAPATGGLLGVQGAAPPSAEAVPAASVAPPSNLPRLSPPASVPPPPPSPTPTPLPPPPMPPQPAPAPAAVDAEPAPAESPDEPIAPRYRRGRAAADAAEAATPPQLGLVEDQTIVRSGRSVLLMFDTGQREQLPAAVSVNLGRSPVPSQPGDRLVVVEDPEQTVSKTHARLEQTRTGVWITDAGSTNGTDLIDEDGTATPVAAGIRTLVPDGVRVRLGNRVFTISRVITEEESA